MSHGWIVFLPSVRRSTHAVHMDYKMDGSHSLIITRLEWDQSHLRSTVWCEEGQRTSCTSGINEHWKAPQCSKTYGQPAVTKGEAFLRRQCSDWHWDKQMSQLALRVQVQLTWRVIVLKSIPHNIFWGLTCSVLWDCLCGRSNWPAVMDNLCFCI